MRSCKLRPLPCQQSREIGFHRMPDLVLLRKPLLLRSLGRLSRKLAKRTCLPLVGLACNGSKTPTTFSSNRCVRSSYPRTVHRRRPRPQGPHYNPELCRPLHRPLQKIPFLRASASTSSLCRAAMPTRKLKESSPLVPRLCPRQRSLLLIIRLPVRQPEGLLIGTR